MTSRELGPLRPTFDTIVRDFTIVTHYVAMDSKPAAKIPLLKSARPRPSYRFQETIWTIQRRIAIPRTPTVKHEGGKNMHYGCFSSGRLIDQGNSENLPSVRTLRMKHSWIF